MLDADTTTRVVAPPGTAEVELAERIALFAIVNRHPRASKVLEGLTQAAAGAATTLVQTAMSWPSGKRQGRAAVEFGYRPDQHERLAHLMAEASPALKVALCAQMSAAQQARFPHLANQRPRQLAGREAFAGRLVREATR